MKIELETSKDELLETVLEIQTRITNKNHLSNRELIEICKNNKINCVTNIENQRIHDLLETAVNIHLLKKYKLKSDLNIYEILADLEELASKLPTQSWRDYEQTELQQFSTPPELAFVMLKLLKPMENAVALEPSAGTGCLASWLKIGGCKVEVNEISNRRRHLLEIQNFNPHKLNAEFIDDLLDEEIKPNFILMNPPFSSNGGRTKKNSNFGFRHIESSLRRLNPGGRLVCLLGKETCVNTTKGRTFWSRIKTEYKIRALLSVPSKAFYKHGTTIETVIIVIDKLPPNKIENSQNEQKQQLLEFCSLTEILQFSESFN
jgi:type I restriction-modification system DNA methylase subunit